MGPGDQPSAQPEVLLQQALEILPRTGSQSHALRTPPLRLRGLVRAGKFSSMRPQRLGLEGRLLRFGPATEKTRRLGANHQTEPTDSVSGNKPPLRPVFLTVPRLLPIDWLCRF